MGVPNISETNKAAFEADRDYWWGKHTSGDFNETDSGFFTHQVMTDSVSVSVLFHHVGQCMIEQDTDADTVCHGIV